MKRYTRAEVSRHGAYVEWVKAHEAEKQRDQLAEALRKIDADLEGRNFLESSSLRDTARAALQALEDQ